MVEIIVFCGGRAAGLFHLQLVFGDFFVLDGEIGA